MDQIRVLVVDNHTVIRHGLRELLRDADGIEVVGEAGSGEEALDAAQRLCPDVVLMDVVMPRMDAAAAIDTFLHRRPGTKVVALRGYDVDENILAALRAGTLSYVSKTASFSDLVHAIRQVAEGQAPLPSSLLAPLRPPEQPPDPLSPREIQVLRQVAKGRSNREIGDVFNISRSTVRTHISHILQKLGAGNRVEATLHALSYGLTTLQECLEPER